MYAKIYENNKWKVCDRGDVIERIKDSKMNMLDKKVTELKDSELISDELQQKYDSFYNIFIDMNEDVQKNVDKEIKLILYNNKGMIKDDKKL